MSNAPAISTIPDQECRPEDLYQAVLETIRGNSAFGILTAAGDAQAQVPWNEVGVKTRDLMTKLAANLTKIQGQR